jgi:hypothetical protein
MGHGDFVQGIERKRALAAALAASHDGGVEALAQTVGKIINLMRAVDFDGLARGIEGHLAVLAAAQVGA